MKKALAFICVLTLVMSLCSVFSFAAVPETEEVEPTSIAMRYAVRLSGTYMYNSASESSGHKYNIAFPIGTVMERINTSSSNGFIYVSCYYNSRTYTGYVLLDHLRAVN